MIVGLASTPSVQQILNGLHVCTLLAELARDPVHYPNIRFHQQFRSTAVRLMAWYVCQVPNTTWERLTCLALFALQLVWNCCHCCDGK
jgi:hypothetical protein